MGNSIQKYEDYLTTKVASNNNNKLVQLQEIIDKVRKCDSPILAADPRRREYNDEWYSVSFEIPTEWKKTSDNQKLEKYVNHILKPANMNIILSRTTSLPHIINIMWEDNDCFNRMWNVKRHFLIKTQAMFYWDSSTVTIEFPFVYKKKYTE